MINSQSSIPSFQAESVLTGGHFELNVFNHLVINRYTDIRKNVFIPGAGVEIDFVSGNNYFEAKGGLKGDKKRPGAKRTDNVKKAIANGALLKAVKPEAHYTVYFSAKPEPESSSDIMLNTALRCNIIDKVVYLEDKVNLFDTLFDTIEWQEMSENQEEHNAF